jgi:prephenate dehydrogenase
VKPAAGGGVVVGIIGGRGAMGRWLERRLLRYGCRVLVADAKLGPVSPEFVAGCQVLVLAVPIGAAEEVMALVGPHTPKNGLVMDIASLKQAPLKSMLAHARGEVVGCHPLCGPATVSLKDQTVFLCPGRGGRWLGWVREFWARQGANVVELEPTRHDRLMARVQTLRHLLLFGLGDALRRLDFSGEEMDLAGPWFRALVELLGRQARQPPALYAELALHNPHAGEALQALQLGLAELEDCLARGNRAGLEEAMARVAAWVEGLGKPGRG